MRATQVLLYTAALMLSGCATIDQVRPGNNPEFTPTNPTSLSTMNIKRNTDISGSIFADSKSLPLFETNTAKQIGDIITVTLSEQTLGISNTRTQVDKDQVTTIANPSIFGNAFSAPKNTPFLLNGPNGAVNLNSTNEFEGVSLSNQNNQLIGSISVTVSEVLSNGNLVIRGEKWINITSGKEYIRLKGIIRPQDISPTNTISSMQVADAQITYSGSGQNQSNQVMGWISKFFSSAIWF